MCSIEEFASLIGNGYAWHAGIYPEGALAFKKEYVEAVQAFALDFDDTPATPDEVCGYARSIGFEPTLWYYSFSQGLRPLNRFRVVWILENSISPDQYESAYRVLLKEFGRFGSIDKCTSDSSRLWFGTDKGVTILNNHPVPLDSLKWIFVQELYKQGKQRRTAKTPEKVLIDEYLALEMPEPVYVSRDWIEQLRPYCDLLDRWCRGEYLDYNQRLSLWTNLKLLRYRDKKKSVINDILAYFQEDVYGGHTCCPEQIREKMHDRKLVPRPIVDVDGERITVAEFFKKERSLANPVERTTLQKLDEELDERIPALLSEPGFAYIVSQTACGKTERIIHFLADQMLDHIKVVVSFPRYDLMDEFAERCRAKFGYPVHTIPRGEYGEKDFLYMELGYPPPSSQDARYGAIQSMMNPASKGLFLCTHKLLSRMKELHADLVIIDENIEDCILQVIPWCS